MRNGGDYMKSSWKICRGILRNLLIAAAIGMFVVTNASAYLHRSGIDIVDDQNKKVILKSFGIGEWLNIEAYFIDWGEEDVGTLQRPVYSHTAIRNKLNQLMGKSDADEFYRRWVANIITEKDVAQYAGWGINSLRISMNYHWLSSADSVWRPEGFALLDSVVAWGKRYHIYIILAMHAAPGGQGEDLMADVSDGNPRLFTESATYMPWTINLWRAIALRYANAPWVGGYDLLDEPLPPDDTNTKTLLPLLKKITSAIREVDKNHLIFMEGFRWSRDFTGMDRPWDENMAYAFHHYDFDGADNNTPQGYKKYFECRTNSGCPIWNGEAGEGSNKWAKSLVTFCEANNVSWCWWTTKKINATTNAYTIPWPTNYEKIIAAAVNGDTISPAPASRIMFEFAENAKSSKCIKNDSLLLNLGLDPDALPQIPFEDVGVIPGPVIMQSPIDLGCAGSAVIFTLQGGAVMKLLMYDAHGALVRAFPDRQMASGRQEISFKGDFLANGFYQAVVLRNGKKWGSVRIVLVR
jgi:hypothetical protein